MTTGDYRNLRERAILPCSAVMNGRRFWSTGFGYLSDSSIPFSLCSLPARAEIGFGSLELVAASSLTGARQEMGLHNRLPRAASRLKASSLSLLSYIPYGYNVICWSCGAHKSESANGGPNRMKHRHNVNNHSVARVCHISINMDLFNLFMLILQLAPPYFCKNFFCVSCLLYNSNVAMSLSAPWVLSNAL